ncbi:MAG: methyl-accepting chemotaxis protein [Spirochaetaceae bacterium]
MRIRSRFVVLFLFLQVVSLLFLSALFYVLLRETITRRVETEALNAVGSIQRMVNLYFSTTVADPNRRHTYLELRGRILEQQLGSQGFFFALRAGSGEIVIHPEEELEGESLAQVAPYAEYLLAGYRGSPQERTIRYRSEAGEYRLLVFVYDPQSGWIIAASAPESELYAPLQRALRRLALLGTVLISVSLLIGGAVVSRFLRPLTYLSRGIAALAEGDFATRLETGGEGRTDELSALLRETERSLRVRLETLIKRVRTISSEGSDLQRELSEDVELGIGHATVIRGKVETLDEELTELMRRVDTLKGELEELSKLSESLEDEAKRQRSSVLTVESTVKEMGLRIDHVRNLGSERMERLKAMDSQFRESRNAQHQLSVALGALEAGAGQILAVNHLIADVAEQTHLLAVNSSIEAARVSSRGQEGHGFNVVAQEMRALSRRSSEGAQQIEGLVRALEENLRSVGQWSENNRDLFARTTAETDELIKAMREILQDNLEIERSGGTIAEELTPLTSISNALIEGSSRLAETTDSARETLASTTAVLSETVATFHGISEETRLVEESQRRMESRSEWSQRNIAALEAFTRQFTISEDEDAPESPTQDGAEPPAQGAPKTHTQGAPESSTQGAPESSTQGAPKTHTQGAPESPTSPIGRLEAS